MLDQVTAESVGIPHKVTQSTCGISSGLLLLVSQELHQEGHTRLEVLVQHVIVEASVTNREAGKLPGVTVWVSATLDGCCNQSKVEQLLVKVAGVTAKVTDQVANLRSD